MQIRLFSRFFLASVLIFIGFKGFTQDSLRKKVDIEKNYIFYQYEYIFPGPGSFLFGVNSTIKTLAKEAVIGLGSGVQTQVQVFKHFGIQLSTDYITSNLNNIGVRKEMYLGYSALYYPWGRYSKRYYSSMPSWHLTAYPFVQLGHGFTFTQISGSNVFTAAQNQSEKQWNQALFFGLGTHLNITSNFDLSIGLRYLMPRSDEIYGIVQTTNSISELTIDRYTLRDFEGRFLATFSVNYAVAKLW